jgi:ubiquinone/menaquinone biosynthesis C-methylase UbiE
LSKIVSASLLPASAKKRSKLPRYAHSLAVHHAAHETELKQAVAELPLRPGSRVLDLACGDGTYCHWLWQRVKPAGSVVAVDLSRAYLGVAREHFGHEDLARIQFVVGRAEQLPLAAESFDVVWIAESMISLPDPVSVLREAKRVTRRRGIVAVLENDPLHDVLVPWPGDLELAIRSVEVAAADRPSRSSRNRFVTRELFRHMRAAGLKPIHRQTYTSDRQAPLDEANRRFLDDYFGHLRCEVGPRLAPQFASDFEKLSDPASPDYLPRRKDFSVTVLHIVAWGARTDASAP